ncbi:MAG: hypothetical protein SCM11_04755 [Bacillota bacterium]|nr:hypothetical protein [Bacillota bacterium]
MTYITSSMKIRSYGQAATQNGGLFAARTSFFWQVYTGCSIDFKYELLYAFRKMFRHFMAILEVHNVPYRLCRF